MEAIGKGRVDQRERKGQRGASGGNSRQQEPQSSARRDVGRGQQRAQCPAKTSGAFHRCALDLAAAVPPQACVPLARGRRRGHEFCGGPRCGGGRLGAVLRAGRAQ
eukprot:1363050-Pyramimonas_sp.AAC.1